MTTIKLTMHQVLRICW